MDAKLSLLKRLRKPRVGVAIVLPDRPFVLGEEIKGTITAKSEEDVEVKEVTFTLICIESKKKMRREFDPVEGEKDEPYWDEAVLSKTGGKVAESLRLERGSRREFPFAMKLPEVGRESYLSVDAPVKWHAVAKVIFVKRRSISARKLIQVTKPSSVRPVTEREIVKEVVMISCRYCGGLMPQTSTFCPNCGARRKA